MAILWLCAVLLATFLNMLVAGFLFAFSVVVMPGIKVLGDNEYLRAFKVMDRVIQDNQPLFLFVWLGSTVALVVAGILGFWQLESLEFMLLQTAVALNLFGIQAPTISVNIPLNNRLQKLNLDTADETTLAELRGEFESRWLRSNTFRTVVSWIVSLLLLVVLYRL